MMNVGDLVRDARFQYRHEIGVIMRIHFQKSRRASYDETEVITVLWSNGSFAGETTEETHEDIQLMEQN